MTEFLHPISIHYATYWTILHNMWLQCQAKNSVIYRLFFLCMLYYFLSFFVYCIHHIFDSNWTADIFTQHICHRTHVNQEICKRIPVEVVQPILQSLLWLIRTKLYTPTTHLPHTPKGLSVIIYVSRDPRHMCEYSRVFRPTSALLLKPTLTYTCLLHLWHILSSRVIFCVNFYSVGAWSH